MSNVNVYLIGMLILKYDLAYLDNQFSKVNIKNIHIIF